MFKSNQSVSLKKCKYFLSMLNGLETFKPIEKSNFGETFNVCMNAQLCNNGTNA